MLMSRGQLVVNWKMRVVGELCELWELASWEALQLIHATGVKVRTPRSTVGHSWLVAVLEASSRV